LCLSFSSPLPSCLRSFFCNTTNYALLRFLCAAFFWGYSAAFDALPSALPFRFYSFLSSPTSLHTATLFRSEQSPSSLYFTALLFAFWPTLLRARAFSSFCRAGALFWCTLFQVFQPTFVLTRTRFCSLRLHIPPRGGPRAIPDTTLSPSFTPHTALRPTSGPQSAFSLAQNPLLPPRRRAELALPPVPPRPPVALLAPPRLRPVVLFLFRTRRDRRARPPATDPCTIRNTPSGCSFLA